MKETKLGHLTLAFGAAWAVLRFGNKNKPGRSQKIPYSGGQLELIALCKMQNELAYSCGEQVAKAQFLRTGTLPTLAED